MKKGSMRKLKVSHLKKNKSRSSTMKKLRQLQKIITNPSYDDQEETNYNNLGSLYQNTANHIFLLQAKLNALKTLSALFGV
uniref:Uncharacterized protein n=1 Tax=Cannabis sativa TaxID=3483 RepID=A0A803R7U8_CANSA